MAAKERDKSKPIWDNAKVKFIIATSWRSQESLANRRASSENF